MEPITPLGAAVAVSALAGKAWDLGRYIHNVYQGTKTVDTRIKKLSSEVHGLASTCDLVHAGLAPVLTGAASEKHSNPYDHDGTLEKSICGQVAHCESTIEELGKIAERLWPRKKKFVDRTIRELKLQDAREQIADLRARIRSHTDALHTVLLVLNIQVAHIAPVQALSRLPDDLDDLRESISRIEATLKRPSVREGTADCEMPALVEYARSTLQSGTTLFNASLAGSTVGADSVTGDEQAAVTNKAVAEWIVSPERQNVLSTPLKHLAGADTHALDSLESPKGEPDCDSDDEKHEFAQAAIDAAMRAFEKHNWQPAKNFFAASKKTLAQLPVSRWRLSVLFWLQFRIARCSYHLGLDDNAESELRELLLLEPDSDEQGIRLCDTHHLLAVVHVRQNRLDAAKEVCERTLIARSRLLGKQHESRLYSIALMSRICELSGETADSEVYLSMIPDEQREKITAIFKELRPSSAGKVASSSPIKTKVPPSAGKRNDPSLRVTECGQPLRKPAPETPKVGLRDTKPCVRQPSNGTGSRTDSSNKICIPDLSPQGRDLQGDGATPPGPSHKGSMLDTTLRNRQTPQSPQPVLKHLGEAEATTVGPKMTSVTPPRRRRATPLAAKEASEIATVLPKSSGEAEQTAVKQKVTSDTPFRRRTTPLPANGASEVAPIPHMSARGFSSKLPDGQSRMNSLIRAILVNNVDAVNALLGCRAPGQARFLMSAKDAHGDEPLYLAIHRAADNMCLPLDIVRSLLEHGADLEEHSVRRGQRVRRGTAKQLALASGRDDLVALVESHAAKVASEHSKD